jgi:hypothetical protein
MAAAVRWLSLLVCLVVASPLLGQHAARWPKGITLFERQDELLAIAASTSLTTIQHPLFYWALVGLISFAAGIWIEWLAKKIDQSRRRKALGRTLVSLARRIDSAQDHHESKWPWSIQHVRVDLQSAFLKTSRLGLWVPDHTIFLRRDANLLISYLTVIGTSLAEGRFADAREESLRCRDLLRAERVQLRTMASQLNDGQPPRHIRVVSARSN